jgi:serine/threonine protein kinase
MQERSHREGEQETEAPLGHLVLEDEEDFETVCDLAPVEVPPRISLAEERRGGREGQRFELLEELDEGGMRQAFRAWDRVLQREVALEFLLGWSARAGQPSGFPWTVARALTRLEHENLVRIFDVLEWRGASSEPSVPFLVREHLEGESLYSLLRRERPEPRRTLALLGAVAAGLAYAHAHHIVHGDLKPSKVFITREGRVKLLDFGLAYLGSGESPLVSQLPRGGTPPYMAPEQWLCGLPDARIDLWAAGILLYEMLTRELPYRAASIQELRKQVLSSEPVPSVRECVPQLPEDVVRLVAELLAKEPGRRLGSASVLRELLLGLEQARAWPRH